jgi:hypothetical protein
MSKLDVWSEGHGSYEDIIQGLNNIDDLSVGELVAKRGIILTKIDCGVCGYQMKPLVEWSEIAMFYVGQEVPETAASRVGIHMKLKCKSCYKDTPVVLDWDDIRRYVDIGVRSGLLDRRIKQAARR